jgi:hypothetical protein
MSAPLANITFSIINKSTPWKASLNIKQSFKSTEKSFFVRRLFFFLILCEEMKSQKHFWLRCFKADNVENG